MGLDDILDIVVIALWVFSVIAGVIVVVNNLRTWRLIKQLRADPEFGPKIEEIIREQARRGKDE